jgi:16S rRNA processing protein RimM
VRDIKRVKSEDYLVLARATSAHGLKGAVNLLPIHPDFDVIGDIDHVVIAPKDSGKEFNGTIQDINFGHKVMAIFKDYSDRTSIEKILPFEIKVKREDFPELDEDDYYFCDLIGLRCVDEKSGEEFGVIFDLYHNGAHNVLSIEGKDGDFDCPMVEAFVKELNFEDGVMKMVRPVWVNE